MITVLGLVLGWFFSVKLGYDSIHMPFGGDWIVGWWMIPLFALPVVAAGNAANISDGLDGLAGGLSAIALVPLVSLRCCRVISFSQDFVSQY